MIECEIYLKSELFINEILYIYSYKSKTMKLSEIDMLEMNDKRLKTDLLLIMSELTKKTIMDIYPIGFSHSLYIIYEPNRN